MRTALVLAIASAATGCGLGASADLPPDDGGLPLPCNASMTVSQDGMNMPLAGPSATMRISAQVSAPGVLDYAWGVQFRGASVPYTRIGDGAAIDVRVPTAGIYRVALQIGGAVSACLPVGATINVGAPGAQTARVRLRVVPSRSVVAPATEQLFDVNGGADSDLGQLRVDSGSLFHPTVMGPSGPVAAYLQFVPAGAPDAVIETYANSSGVASVQLLAARYAVLVVPSVAGAASRRFASWSPGSPLMLDAGSAVTGNVHGPTNAPLAGAMVQVVSDGVPSTLATTAADGSFALRATLGASITVEVTPPAGSGLPQLSATSTHFDLISPVEVRYAANVMLADLAGTALRRSGAPLGGARLTVVGTLAAVGTVTTGPPSTTQVASGAIRISAVASAAGILPAMPVPAVAMSAVIQAAPDDFAVVALDAGAPPSSLQAPPRQLVTTAMLDLRGGGLPGGLVDLVPVGPLALAGAPTLRITAAADGAIAANLPSGGRFELRFQDPVQRAAPLVVADRAITMIASSYRMPATIRLEGALRDGGGLSLRDAAVQLMCEDCSGIERAMPLSEILPDDSGRFTLAVPDPGTR